LSTIYNESALLYFKRARVINLGRSIRGGASKQGCIINNNNNSVCVELFENENSLTRTKHTKQHDDTLLLLLSCHAAVSAAWWLLNVVKSYMGTPQPCLVYLGTCYFRHRWNKPEELCFVRSRVCNGGQNCRRTEQCLGDPGKAPVNRENNSNLGGPSNINGHRMNLTKII
jgi:hypothetical protein